MNNKKSSLIQEYITTFIVTIIVVFSLCMVVELQLYFNIEKFITSKELQMKNLSKFYNIDQLEKMHRNDPNNYMISLNLAKAYESVEQYNMANELYKEAVIKSKNSEYTIYSYALFAAKRRLYGLSADLAEELYSKNKLIYRYKTEIYSELAHTFDKDNQFEAAVKAYQLAYKYAKNTQNKHLLEKIKDEYSMEYVKLADYNISINKTDEAILNLKNSLSIKEQDIANYKLAIIYKDSDKVKAEKIFAKVFRNNPYIVNPYIYNKLLEDLILENKKRGDKYYANYYQTKLENLRNKIQNYYTYKGDFLFDNSHITKCKKLFKKESKYELYFDIKNNGKPEVGNLFVKTEILINNKTYTVIKQILNNKDLTAVDEINNAKIELPDDFEFTNNNKNGIKDNITIKYYVKKQKKAPWTLAKIEFLNF